MGLGVVVFDLGFKTYARRRAHAVNYLVDKCSRRPSHVVK